MGLCSESTFFDTTQHSDLTGVDRIKAELADIFTIGSRTGGGFKAKLNVGIVDVEIDVNGASRLEGWSKGQKYDYVEAKFGGDVELGINNIVSVNVGGDLSGKNKTPEDNKGYVQAIYERSSTENTSEAHAGASLGPLNVAFSTDQLKEKKGTSITIGTSLQAIVGFDIEIDVTEAIDYYGYVYKSLYSKAKEVGSGILQKLKD
ncbi:hypothetical protein EW093_07715 [Thiospirochaeta perfilievii]|uniref:Uncharacterized protein n=1 Tax=Thiospirochaeta perfilievii TaxID=252967 RepID=A0A5C1QD03_9SPIO|nr:hypothetical protein [Thiospirochaeta perfilievii]QEN04594.1 hypothetical protein EW093_07715 [Thiospirochaeta perfilievii]